MGPSSCGDSGPAGSDGLPGDGWQQGSSRVNIYDSVEMVPSEGVLEDLQGPDLRACANVETMPLGIAPSLLDLPSKLTSCLLSLGVKT